MAAGERRASVGSVCLAVLRDHPLLFVSLATIAAVVAFSSCGTTKAAEEEEVDISSAAIFGSSLLLGGITSVMGVFYLLNHSDEDISRYAWGIMADTLAIFSAVLFFQACDRLVDEYITRPFGYKCLVDFGHMIFWFCVLQYVIALLTGALVDKELVEDKIVHSSRSSGSETWLEFLKRWTKRLSQQVLFYGSGDENARRRKENVTCICGLMAHIVGFATLNAWGNVQHLCGLFGEGMLGPLGAFLVVPLAYGSMTIIFDVLNKARERMLLADEELDEYEEMFDEQTEDAENDVLSVSCSFLTVQAVRYAISGTLPSTEGLLAKGADKPGMEVVFLSVTALVWLLLAFFLVWSYRYKLKDKAFYDAGTINDEQKMTDHDKEAIAKPFGAFRTHTFIKRQANMLQATVTMCFSWSLVFTGKEVMVWGDWFDTDESIQNRVMLAVSLSGIIFLLICSVDDIVDNYKRLRSKDDNIDEYAYVVVKILDSKGLAIGFCWEQAFDSAVLIISSNDKSPNYVGMFFLSVFVLLIVIPALRRFIFPTAQRKREEFWREHMDGIRAGHCGQEAAEYAAAAEKLRTCEAEVRRAKDELEERQEALAKAKQAMERLDRRVERDAASSRSRGASPAAPLLQKVQPYCSKRF